jgi:UDP-glucose 4-epimerase
MVLKTLNSKSTPPKALVTGGAGFIGSHIAEEMVKRGWQVTIIDDLSTGRMENIQRLLAHNSLSFLLGSITDLPLLQAAFKGVDYVFHQAAIPSVPSSIENPLATHEVNITGTLNVLLAARDNKVKKVVFASSCAIYGNEPTLPKKEDMPADPQSPYAVSKLTAEYYCSVFTNIFRLPTVCLRYFNVYGPRQNPSSEYAAVIPKFIKVVTGGKAPTIYGDGEQTRDFVYVNDVVRANLLAAESDITGVFNIGTGEKISLNQLVQVILKTMSRNEIKPLYAEEKPGEVKHSLADISKAGAFGWKPEYRVHKGLDNMLREQSVGNHLG